MKCISPAGSLLPALLVMFLSSGCNTQVIKVRGSISAAADINRNIRNQPAPVEVRIYQLTGAAKFSAAGYNSFVKADRHALGTELLRKEQFIVRPGQSVPYNTNMAAETRYIGIVGLFRKPGSVVWKKLYKVSFLRNEGLEISLTSGGIVLNRLPQSRTDEFEALRDRD